MREKGEGKESKERTGGEGKGRERRGGVLEYRQTVLTAHFN